MEWDKIYDDKVCSAYEFLDSVEIDLLLSNCEEKPNTTERIEVIEWLIQEYGSDADVIQAVIEKKYPYGRYFWLCDYIDDTKRQEEYFHVRVWELKPTVDDEHNPYSLKGDDIDRFYTIGSMYNNGCIGVESNKDYYRLRVEELNKIKDQLRFKVDLASESGDNRRTNNYLEIIEN